MENSVVEKEIYVETQDIPNAHIKVVSVGGCGTKSLDRILEAGLLKNADINGIETIALNADSESLEALKKIGKKIFLKLSSAYTENAAWSSEDYNNVTRMIGNMIDDALSDADVVVVVAGLGGVAGSNISTIVADIANKKGAVVLSILITPFSKEIERCMVAKNAIETMKRITPLIVLLDNDKLVQIASDLKVGEAFRVFDRAISEIINTIVESFEKTYFIPIQKILDTVDAELVQTVEQEDANPAGFKDGLQTVSKLVCERTWRNEGYFSHADFLKINMYSCLNK